MWSTESRSGEGLHPRFEVAAIVVDAVLGPFLHVEDRGSHHLIRNLAELLSDFGFQSNQTLGNWRVGFAFQITPQKVVARIHVGR